MTVISENYAELLRRKVIEATVSGFLVDENSLNKHLFSFQRDIVKRALQHGRFAIFADCGLGKTLMQLEWANQVRVYSDKPILILTPLAVAGQTVQEAVKFAIPGVVRFAIGMPVDPERIYVAHYDQLDHIPVDEFGGVVLDESSILKNFSGSTKRALLTAFQNTPYKLSCTATPSPNDPMELGNQSEFLGVLSYTQMLAMYFTHDGADTSKWRIKRHARHFFWKWVSGWAIMLTSPADIGFDGSTYVLPELNLIEKQLTTAKQDNGKIFNDTAVTATTFHAQLRLTKVDRLETVAAIVNASNEPFIVWVEQDAEEELLCKLIPDAVPVRGSMKPERKESRLLGFARNEFRVLVTKKKMASFGLNYQHCHNQVFASLDFSFEGLYQAIRRSYRFGQKQPVNVYLITTDTMENVVTAIRKKQSQFDRMRADMSAVIQSENGLSASITNQPFNRPYWLKSL